ncbi:amidohydrolase [Agathobaculum desmolans]|uniref:amidohydrolase n=1 Tax=Agathobaculum desmolans TaxID=39484 RepID=UPI0004E21232|nr:amidohydrolase [Agathobaculum desmolans]
MNQILIKNVTVWTMDAQDRRFTGWVLLEQGRIARMGEGEPPDCAEVLDGAGGILTPGLIDIHSHLGLYEDGLGFEGADGNEDTDPVTPQLRVIDGINPFDRSFREAVEAGVTATAVSPGSANPIGGQIALIKTAGRRVDDMIVRAPLAVKFALGENPKSVYHDKDESPVTRMATAALIREQLYKAQEYLARKERAAHDPDEDAPDHDSKLEALVPLLRGEVQAHFHAHRADDIFTALRIANEFHLHAVIIHGTEAHLVADLLAEEGVPVVSGPYMTDRSKPEIRNLTDAAPGLLCRAGIPTAVTVDHPEIPLRLLPMALMLAVRAGMDRTDALRAVTSVPAEIAGMAHRMGSLQPGMDADCVLWSGDPLDIMTEVQAVFVNGVPEYRRTV